MKELTRDYICNNSPRFSEKLDVGCYNDIILIIVGLIVFSFCFVIIIHYIKNIIDLLNNK